MCQNCSDSASVSVDRVIWKYKSDVNLCLAENSNEPSSSTTSTESPFNDDHNEESLNVNKVCHQY